MGGHSKDRRAGEKEKPRTRRITGKETARKAEEAKDKREIGRRKERSRLPRAVD